MAFEVAVVKDRILQQHKNMITIAKSKKLRKMHLQLRMVETIRTVVIKITRKKIKENKEIARRETIKLKTAK